MHYIISSQFDVIYIFFATDLPSSPLNLSELEPIGSKVFTFRAYDDDVLEENSRISFEIKGKISLRCNNKPNVPIVTVD